MTTPYQHTSTGSIHYPGQIVDGVQTHDRMSPEAWAALGCVPYTPPDPAPELLPDAKARRLAELAADYEASVQSALPIPLRLEIEAGLREPGGQAAYAEALLDFRAVYDAAVAAIAGAWTVEELSAVAWTWPTVEVAQ